MAARGLARRVREECGPRAEAERVEHDEVLVAGVVGRCQQLVPVKHRICARQEAQRLIPEAEGLAASREPDHAEGHDDPGGRDAPHEVHHRRRVRGPLPDGRPLDGDELVDGDALRVRRERRELREEPDSVGGLLAEADDPARADADARPPEGFERRQAVLVLAGAGDLGVVLGARVEVVVVGRHTRVGELARVLVVNHPHGGADLQAKPADTTDHLQDALPLPLAHLVRTPPCGSHAEPGAS
mmetsp:Transcript_5607/g.13614  ORF Transcript_5607/g.13614 Transcript_5607/m.13614 type:complete len:243 (+) Transcript_5607:1231-1959(+)